MAEAIVTIWAITGVTLVVAGLLKFWRWYLGKLYPSRLLPDDWRGEWNTRR